MPVAGSQPVFPPPSGSPIQSVWGQAVSEHVVQRFANEADRDAKWTSPPNGAVCITLDTNILWQHQSGGWVYSQTAIPNQAMGTTHPTGMLRIIAEQVIVTTNSNGDGGFSYPQAFASGVNPQVIMQNGDPGGGNMIFGIYNSLSSSADVNFRVVNEHGTPIVGAVRINYIAIGRR